MEIVLDKRQVRQIHLAAQEAIEEGDIESLRESIMNQFSDDQIEEIERRLESGDFYEFLSDCLMEWSGDDVDELKELLETELGEAGVDLKFEAFSEEEEDEAVEDDFEPGEDDDEEFDEEDEDEDEDDE